MKVEVVPKPNSPLQGSLEYLARCPAVTGSRLISKIQQCEGQDVDRETARSVIAGNKDLITPPEMIRITGLAVANVCHLLQAGSPNGAHTWALLALDAARMVDRTPLFLDEVRKVVETDGLEKKITDCFEQVRAGLTGISVDRLDKRDAITKVEIASIMSDLRVLIHQHTPSPLQDASFPRNDKHE